MKSTVKNMFNVLFFVRRDRVKADGKAPINARITINGKHVSFNVNKTGKFIGVGHNVGKGFLFWNPPETVVRP